MDICIISNSHAASLKSGWEGLSERFPNVEITFFAAANRGMAKVIYNSSKRAYVTKDTSVRKMLVKTSDGYGRIDIDSYDAFLVYGLFLDVPKLDVRLSEAVKSAALDDTASYSLNFRFVKELAENTDCPVFYAASPMPAEVKSSSLSCQSEQHLYPEASSWIEARYAHLRASMIKQSEDTLDEKGYSKAEFTSGSIRLKLGEVESHSSKDYKHMNGVYGAHFLEKAIPKIRSHVSLTIGEA